MVVTISSLPFELIEIILEQVNLLGGPLILQCAQVCSSWTTFSLKLLYRHVEITSPDVAKRMATSSGFETYGTEILDVGCSDDTYSFHKWNMDMGTIVRRSAATIQKLGLWRGYNVPSTLFCDVSFPRLHTLSMECQFTSANTTLTPKPYPLSFTSFSVDIIESFGTEFALRSIATAFLDGGIHEGLKLRVANVGYVKDLRPLAPYIKSLTLYDDDEISIPLEHLTFISSPSVENLNLQWVSISNIKLILQHTTSQLRSLEVLMAVIKLTDGVELLSKVLTGPTFSNLEELRLVEAYPGDFDIVGRAVNLIETLKEKGVSASVVDRDKAAFM